MFSFTLQTNDTAMVSGDRLGQIQYAASNESDGSAAILIGGALYAQAEGVFNGTQNPTSLVLATATSDANAATGKIKISDSGHVLPMSDDKYDLGNTNLGFRTSYFTDGVVLKEVTPADTTDKLYQNGGSLFFDGSAVGGGGGGGSMTTVKNNGSQVGGADIVTLDFSSNFSATESPDTEINIELASSISTDTLTLTKAYKSSVETNTDGATITFDLNESNLHEVTLGGNRTLAISNETVGQRFIIKLIQDGTGSRTVTWFSTIKWPGGFEPSLTETVNKADYFSFIVTGTDTYDGFVLGYSL
jgi:hypothetical protein